MFGRMIKRAIFGAVGTWAWRRGKRWWDEREGTGGAHGRRRPPGTRSRSRR